MMLIAIKRPCAAESENNVVIRHADIEALNGTDMSLEDVRDALFEAEDSVGVHCFVFTRLCGA